MTRSFLILLFAAFTLSACTHGREWSTYRIRIVTNPSGAECYFERDGVITTAPEPTPVDITMTNIGEDIGIVCSKEGYKAASTTTTGFFGGGLLGDVFSRRKYRYPDYTFTLDLEPL